MKYKLLKDLPGFGAELLFTIDAQGVSWSRDGIDWQKLAKNHWLTNFFDYRSPISEHEWFEPVEDTPTRWRAAEHDYFYYLDEYLEVESVRESRMEDSKVYIDKQYNSGNYFRTQAQAEAAAEAIKAVLEAIHEPDIYKMTIKESVTQKVLEARELTQNKENN